MITRLFPFYNESAVVLVLPVRFKETERYWILRCGRNHKFNTMQKIKNKNKNKRERQTERERKKESNRTTSTVSFFLQHVNRASNKSTAQFYIRSVPVKTISFFFQIYFFKIALYFFHYNYYCYYYFNVKQVHSGYN